MPFISNELSSKSEHITDWIIFSGMCCVLLIMSTCPLYKSISIISCPLRYHTKYDFSCIYECTTLGYNYMIQATFSFNQCVLSPINFNVIVFVSRIEASIYCIRHFNMHVFVLLRIVAAAIMKIVLICSMCFF